MRSHWYSKLGGREVLMGESESKEKEELALNAEQKTRKFNGKCNNKPGHMAKDCWHNKNSRNNKNNGGGKPRNRFKGKYNYCGKVGHKEAYCWEKFLDKKKQRNSKRKVLKKSERYSAEALIRIRPKTPNMKIGWGIRVPRGT